jgi:hypothetical protein
MSGLALSHPAPEPAPGGPVIAAFLAEGAIWVRSRFGVVKFKDSPRPGLSYETAVAARLQRYRIHIRYGFTAWFQRSFRSSSFRSRSRRSSFRSSAIGLETSCPVSRSYLLETYRVCDRTQEPGTDRYYYIVYTIRVVQCIPRYYSTKFSSPKESKSANGRRGRVF